MNEPLPSAVRRWGGVGSPLRCPDSAVSASPVCLVSRCVERNRARCGAPPRAPHPRHGIPVTRHRTGAPQHGIRIREISSDPDPVRGLPQRTTACSRVEAAHTHHEAARGSAGPSGATGVFLNILTSVRGAGGAETGEQDGEQDAAREARRRTKRWR